MPKFMRKFTLKKFESGEETVCSTRVMSPKKEGNRRSTIKFNLLANDSEEPQLLSAYRDLDRNTNEAQERKLQVFKNKMLQSLQSSTRDIKVDKSLNNDQYSLPIPYRHATKRLPGNKSCNSVMTTLKNLPND